MLLPLLVVEYQYNIEQTVRMFVSCLSTVLLQKGLSFKHINIFNVPAENIWIGIPMFSQCLISVLFNDITDD